MAKINIDKLLNTIIYLCQNTNPRIMSETKILKLLFLGDFEHINKYGRPITYDTYRHLEHGPIPSLAKNFLDNITRKKDFDLGKDLDKFVNTFVVKNRMAMNFVYPGINLKPHIVFNDELFSESEIEILQWLCKKYYSTSAKILKNITHEHKGYKATEMNDVIDYRYGFDAKSEIEYYDFWNSEKAELKFCNK